MFFFYYYFWHHSYTVTLTDKLATNTLNIRPQKNIVSGFRTDPAQKGPTLNFFFTKIFFLAVIPHITKLFFGLKIGQFPRELWLF